MTELPENGWFCVACGQNNAQWASECGQCSKGRREPKGLGPFSPQLQDEVLGFLALLAEEPFLATPDVTKEALGLLWKIAADQQVGR